MPHEAPAKAEKTTMASLDFLLKEVYERDIQSMLERQIREERIWLARAYNYKRPRDIRTRWTWRRHAKLGQLAERYGIMGKLDYIRWLHRVAILGYNRTDSDHCVCCSGIVEYPAYRPYVEKNRKLPQKRKREGNDAGRHKAERNR